MIDNRSQLIASVERELAELQSVDRLVADDLTARARRGQSESSVVYSIRLSGSEITALERRAAALGLKPSVLARDLVRVGLHSGQNKEVAEAMNRLQGAVEELRVLVA